MIFNYWTRDFLVVKEGEEICSDCKGHGVEISSLLKNGKVLCVNCYGHGVLDWVEKAVGKKSLAISTIEF